MLQTLYEFQFHKGTIKTTYLKQFQAKNLNFNSIKVRLKLCDLVCYGVAQTFQFHKGTIKTLSSLATSKDAPISIP